ncbi:MAG: GAF domain-containing protein [Polyangiaceae bacterium]
MSELPRQVRSDPPVEDLKRERDAFIQQFFRRGAQISEELLGEMEKLRGEVQSLEAENARLKAHIASDDAIKNLLTKIKELEVEKDELIAKSVRSMPAPDDFTERFAEVENELANLGTLHVAGLQLHTGTTVRRALRNIKELCAQFLGAAQFVVYLATDDGASLVPISVDGITQKEAREISVDDHVGKAFAKGEITYDRDGDPSRGSLSSPAAVIPIGMSGHAMGAIAIFRTLPQKTSFVGVDNELFKLLAAQAGPALVNARLFEDAGRRVPGVQSFIDQED